MGTLRAGIYGRNSKGEAKSIDDQLELGEAAVTEQGWTLANSYSDRQSASRYASKTRDDWARLLADIAADRLDILVLWESSRGGREEIEWFGMLNTCRTQGVLIHVISHERTYDMRISRDRKVLANDGVDAAYYSDELSDKVRRGVAASARKGGIHGACAYGYERVYDEHTREFIEQRPSAHAPIVVEIFEALARKTPIITLVADLNGRGIPSPNGKVWSRDTVRRMARNVSYIGQRRHRTKHEGKAPTDEITKAVWPRLVEDSVFYDVQAVLDDDDRPRSKPGKARYLLSYNGCAPCGGALRVQPKRGTKSERYLCVEDSCISARMADVDEIVTRAVCERLSMPDARKLYAVDDAEVRKARTEAAKLRTDLDKARKSYALPDGISETALAMKERTYGPLIADADRRARPVGSSGALARLLDADDVRAEWDTYAVAAKRDVVARVVRVVVGSPTRRLSRLASDDDRLEEALARLGESRWNGDAKTWRELLRD